MGIMLILILGVFVTLAGFGWTSAAMRERRSWRAIQQAYGLVPYGTDVPGGERGRSAATGVCMIFVGLAIAGSAGLMLSGQFTFEPKKATLLLSDPRTGEPVEMPLTSDDQRRMRSEPGAVYTEKYMQLQQDSGVPMK